jgi:hypothetical protein
LRLQMRMPQRRSNIIYFLGLCPPITVLITIHFHPAY